jgi:hypothetical protein
MTVNVAWYDDEKTIILQEFPVEWTWDEFYAAVQQSIELEKSVSHTVYVMGTNPPNAKTPSGNALNNFKAALRMHPSNMRWYIIATSDMLTRVLGYTVLRAGIFGEKLRVVRSVEEGLKLIEQDKLREKV